MNRAPSVHRIVAAVLLACASTVPVRAQNSLEYNVKAALLLNFARFIEWPDRAFADSRSELVMCLFESNPFGDALTRALQGETIGEHPITLRVVHDSPDSAPCHLLFVPAGTESRAAALIRKAGPHTVTVGESRRFEDLGGAVNFVLEGGRVRFNVHMRPVEARGVRISARMLNLANRVDRTTRPEK